MKYLSSIFVFIIVLSSCTVKVDDDEQDLTKITDSKGVRVSIEWKDGLGSVQGGLENIDLDMYLSIEGELIDSSTNEEQFESIEIKHYYLDSLFNVGLLYYSGNEDSDFDLFIRGIDDPTEIVKVSGNIAVDTLGRISTVVSIDKKGHIYYIQ